MKRTEIAMIILVASLSMILTFTLAQSLLGDKIKRKASVEYTSAVSEDLVEPSKRIFNSEAINPTVEVCVESDNNNNTTTAPEDATNDVCKGSATTSSATDSSDSQSTDTQSSTTSGTTLTLNFPKK